MLEHYGTELMRDPEFLADAEKEKQPVGPKIAAEATQIVNPIYAVPADIIEASRAATK